MNIDYNDPEAQEQILWFARALYSETKVVSEQMVIAQVIKNRVLSERYPDTYKAVVLQPHQFSGLRASDPQYKTVMSLTYGMTGPGWNTALAIAEMTYYGMGDSALIGSDVMHFYSPISVSRDPKWALDLEPVYTVADPAGRGVRFAFYAGVK